MSRFITGDLALCWSDIGVAATNTNNFLQCKTIGVGRRILFLNRISEIVAVAPAIPSLLQISNFIVILFKKTRR